MKIYLFLALALVGLTACNVIASPVALETVPVFPGAQVIDPATHPVVAAEARQAKQAMANGHKSEVRAYLLPQGTTPAQVKEFYVSKLSQLGGQVVITLGDEAPFGNITLNHGSESVIVSYDSMIQAQPPLLTISSFIPNSNR